MRQIKSLKLVCDGSLQNYIDTNTGTTYWDVHYYTTHIFPWGTLATTSETVNEYCYEITGFHMVLDIRKSVCHINNISVR